MNIRLKEFRLANEISQADVAKEIGLSQSALSRTEALGRNLSDIQIGKLCKRWGKKNVMKFVGSTVPPDLTYISLTKEQLYDFAKDVAKNILMELGIEFDEVKAKFTTDRKNEYMPLEYWLQKLNVNRTTVWRWQKQGLITPRYIGKKLFFCQDDFDELFEKQKHYL